MRTPPCILTAATVRSGLVGPPAGFEGVVTAGSLAGSGDCWASAGPAASTREPKLTNAKRIIGTIPDSGDGLRSRREPGNLEAREGRRPLTAGVTGTPSLRQGAVRS